MRVALLYPELLSTYGDGGNALVLTERARRRGIEADAVSVALADPLPNADIYLLGGGEDGPQRQAADALRRDGTLAERVHGGAVVLAVCAGLQVLGRRFAVAGHEVHEGLGLLDLETVRGASRRVGDLLTRVGDETLVGFENHGGDTVLGAVAPLGRVEVGYGNNGQSDGCRTERVYGTYAHGPVLALNPWLADELISLALGRSLGPLGTVADRLHARRCAVVAQAGRRP